MKYASMILMLAFIIFNTGCDSKKDPCKQGCGHSAPQSQECQRMLGKLSQQDSARNLARLAVQAQQTCELSTDAMLSWLFNEPVASPETN